MQKENVGGWEAPPTELGNTVRANREAAENSHASEVRKVRVLWVEIGHVNPAPSREPGESGLEVILRCGNNGTVDQRLHFDGANNARTALLGGRFLRQGL